MDAIVASFIQLLKDVLNVDQITSEIITATIIFLSCVLITWVVHAIIERHFSKWAKKTKSSLDDKIIHEIKLPLLLIAILFGAYYSLETLSIIAVYRDTIRGVFIIAEIFAIAFMLTRISSILISWYGNLRAKQNKTVSNHLLFTFNKVIQIIILLGAVISILWAFGQDLSNIVVGLGIGSIAIALAVQNTLSDILSAFSIYFDRPFEIGDFIVIGDYSGTVTRIGIKSTRLQLLQGEELVVSNNELTTANIRNYKKLEKRRINFKIGVAYDTPTEKLEKIPKIIEQIIKNIKFTEFDRAHFYEFGDFSLKFEIIYYVTSQDYRIYMDTQQAINFAIRKELEREGIQMAFPTQTIFLNKKPD